jgi:hypothetical protein
VESKVKEEAGPLQMNKKNFVGNGLSGNLGIFLDNSILSKIVE